jgi:nitrogen fixation NifU-like protein
MNQELKELYQQVILDHNKNPRNYKKIEYANHTAEGYNPLCGDKIDVYLQTENGMIKDISFLGSGCAISKASASLMSSFVKGKSIEEAKEIFDRFHELITGKLVENDELESLGKLQVFAGVREFPVRVKCASLAWHTMLAALKEDQKTITTE